MASDDFVQEGETFLLAVFRRNRDQFGMFTKAEMLPCVTSEGKGKNLRLVDDRGAQLILPDPTELELKIVLEEAGVTIRRAE